MSRYVIGRPRAYKPMICEDAWYTDPVLPSLSVDDNQPADTGLITATGEPIYRLPGPFGFEVSSK